MYSVMSWGSKPGYFLRIVIRVRKGIAPGALITRVSSSFPPARVGSQHPGGGNGESGGIRSRVQDTRVTPGKSALNALAARPSGLPFSPGAAAAAVKATESAHDTAATAARMDVFMTTRFKDGKAQNYPSPDPGMRNNHAFYRKIAAGGSSMVMENEGNRERKNNGQNDAPVA